MTPEAKARQNIDKKLEQSGWTLQDMKTLNPSAALGVAVREFPTSTGPVDYALFVGGVPVGVVEAKKDEAGENITVVERQSHRYANSVLKYVSTDYEIRFAYEATGEITRFTDYHDVKYRSRRVFSFLLVFLSFFLALFSLLRDAFFTPFFAMVTNRGFH